jgi:hypothetical protein
MGFVARSMAGVPPPLHIARIIVEMGPQETDNVNGPTSAAP